MFMTYATTTLWALSEQTGAAISSLSKCGNRLVVILVQISYENESESEYRDVAISSGASYIIS